MRMIFNPWRNPGRTAGTLASIALAGSAALLLVTAAINWERQVTTKHTGRGTDILISRTSKKGPLLGTIDLKVAERLRTIPGVLAAEPSAWDLYGTGTSRPLGMTAWPKEAYLWPHLRVLDGFAPNDPGLPPRPVFLGRSAAQVLSKVPGDQLPFHRSDLTEMNFNVAGIVESEVAQENLLLFFFLPDFLTAMGREGRINLINVRLKDSLGPQEVEAVISAMERVGRGLAAVRVGEWTRGKPARRAADAMLCGTGLVAMLLLVPGLSNSLLMHLQEHRREAGLLLAVGWSRWRILQEVVILALTLTILGAGLAVVIAATTAALLARLPTMTPFFSLGPAPIIWWAFLGGVLLTALLSCLVPAWHLWRLTPVNALQNP